MNKKSVYIICYNEERKIEAAIKSVLGWADEIIVADSFSTDNTVKIAENFGAKVIQIPFENFGKLRNVAIDSCSYNWIFSLDSDERCTASVQKEIDIIISQHTSNNPTTYFVPRKNYLLGKWVKYSGWYPDYRQPQLFKKGTLRYNEDLVHETYTTDTAPGHLKEAIWQFPFENLQQMFSKADRYSTLGAKKLLGKRKGGIGVGLLHGFAAIFQCYILKRGFLDGRSGIAIAVYNFTYTFYKYAKLAELEANWGSPDQL
ncbi:MAG: glycosyltransferase family 2 protein [Bacteroidota bacterium]|jgi:glycosyltransferase involved in cell wall biosynthesis